MKLPKKHSYLARLTFLFFTLIYSSVVSATPLHSAIVFSELHGSTTPPVIYGSELVNGDFLIKNEPPNTKLLGNGVDESTYWTFDFTSDPEWDNFHKLISAYAGALKSAILTLTITPKHSLVTNDFILATDLAYTLDDAKSIYNPNPDFSAIQNIPVNTTETIHIDLIDIYSSAYIYPSMEDEGIFLASSINSHYGKLNFMYVDDAIISYARMSMYAYAVPAPSILTLFALGLICLGFTMRKHRNATT